MSKAATASFITRAQKRVFKQAIEDSADRVAVLANDPAATTRAARAKAFQSIDNQAAEMPTKKRAKIVDFAKRGVRIR
jgi:hypothetical protein